MLEDVPLSTALRYLSARPLLPPSRPETPGAPGPAFEAPKCCQGADQFGDELCI